MMSARIGEIIFILALTLAIARGSSEHATGIGKPAKAGTPNHARFVVDDDEYMDKVTAESAKLRKRGRLHSPESLRAQMKTKGFAFPTSIVATQRFSPPDLCERLRQSTLAVGSYYKCPDCSEWHFNASGGFVVAENGIVCTCCHVVLAEDEGVKESYLVVADADGHVFAVESVLAADTEADTCFLKVDASGLKPLPLRPGVRAGERVYCLSHPGGYHYLFTDGLIARVNRRRDQALDWNGRSNTNGVVTRPIVYLNVTAEFAPGSSGSPLVDEAGNVVAQVSSIAEAGEPDPGDETTAASPSVPVRFCLAAEEILNLTDPHLRPSPPEFKPVVQHPSHQSSTNRPPKAHTAK
jgi:S1-C subfamily serine protease